MKNSLAFKNPVKRKGVMTMSKLVAHLGKWKMGNLQGIEKHNKRIYKNHSNTDINASKSYLNYDLVACPNSYKNAYQAEMDKYYSGKRKVRSDATVVDEWIFSASNDFFANLSKDEEKRFFSECLNFMENNFGHTIYATVHVDESTPHMHLGMVPITADGRLSHKDIFGRNALKKLHSDLYKHLTSQGFTLEPPQPNDKKHLSVKDFKAKALDDKIAKNKQILQDQQLQYEKKQNEFKEQAKQIQDEVKAVIDNYKQNALNDLNNKEKALNARESSYKADLDKQYDERKKTLDAFYAKENDKLTQRESEVRYKEYSLGEREKKIDERDAEVTRKERNFASKYNKAKEVVNHADEIEKRLDAKIALYKRLTSTKEDTAILTGLLTSIKQEYGQSVADALYDKAVNGVDATSYVNTQQLDDYKQFKRQTVKSKQVDDLEF